MTLSINDIFSNKEDLIEGMKKYATENNITFNIQETPRSIVLVCRGNEEFNCDVGITATFRKKDKKYIVKKIRTSHKCPITDSSFTSSDEYIKSEIQKNIGNASVRIGDIVSILHNQGVKTSYPCVWKILRGSAGSEKRMDCSVKECDDEDKENTGNRPVGSKKRKIEGFSVDIYKPKNAKYYNSTVITDADIQGFEPETFYKFHEHNEIIEEFCDELSSINQSKISIQSYGKMILYTLPSYYDILLPIVEIRYYKRTNGLVIYGVLYDPLFDPIIYACLVSEGVENRVSFNYFLKSLPSTLFIVEYDVELIKLLESMNIDYFIKTRDICKHIYSIDKNQSNIENIWANCNTQDTPISELSWIDKKHYLKTKCDRVLMSINNLPECDLDFVMYGVYNLPFFECINAIIKLSTDNLKLRKKFTITDSKSLFGSNVVSKLERNRSIKPLTKMNVDLGKCVCECGKFQEYLIPCEHACEIIRGRGEDPYFYVSTLYSRELLYKLEEIMPVMDISVRCQPDRVCGRKGPGRPKKGVMKEGELAGVVS